MVEVWSLFPSPTRRSWPKRRSPSPSSRPTWKASWVGRLGIVQGRQGQAHYKKYILSKYYLIYFILVAKLCYTCCQIVFLHKVSAILSILLSWCEMSEGLLGAKLSLCQTATLLLWNKVEKERFLIFFRSRMLFSKRGQKVEMLAGSTNEDHQVGDVLPQNLMLGTFGYFYILFFRS